MTDTQEKLLTPLQVAEHLGVSRDRVYEWMRAGIVSRQGERVKLARVRAGWAIRISPAALAEFLRACDGAEAEEAPAPRKRRDRRARAESEALGRALG